MRNIKPFVKWAGGKTQLLPELVKRLPLKFETYYEPFVGCGALMFYIENGRAVIGDANLDLISAYWTIQDTPSLLINELEKCESNETYYYKMRAKQPISACDKAVRFLYLNKHCFNALMRYNRKGKFNSPWGKHTKVNYNFENIKACSEYLKNHVTVRCCDFSETIKNALENDFVYFDPPYDGTFTGYTPTPFNQDEHKRLFEQCKRLDTIGTKWMLSNSDTAFIRNLYRGYNIETVQARRSINCDKNGRGKVNELIIRNYGAN